MKLSVIAPSVVALAAIGGVVLAVPLLSGIDFSAPLLLLAATVGVVLLRPRR